MLTYLDIAVLAFEGRRWNRAGAKEQAITDAFGLMSHRYYQTLGAVIDLPQALEYDPMLVGRLRRLRDTRQGRRTSRR